MNIITIVVLLICLIIIGAGIYFLFMKSGSCLEEGIYTSPNTPIPFQIRKTTSGWEGGLEDDGQFTKWLSGDCNGKAHTYTYNVSINSSGNSSITENKEEIAFTHNSSTSFTVHYPDRNITFTKQ